MLCEDSKGFYYYKLYNIIDSLETLMLILANIRLISLNAARLLPL